MGHGKTEPEHDFSSRGSQSIWFKKTSKSFQAGRQEAERKRKREKGGKKGKKTIKRIHPTTQMGRTKKKKNKTS